MRRVLVTGGNGCLGTALIDRLLDHGDEVLSIDNHATASPDSLPPHPRLRTVTGSIVDARLVDAMFDDFRPSHVIHAAASYKDPNDWREDAATNVDGTINVVRAAQRLGVGRFIHFQTALCYGRPQERPVTLRHPLAPLSSYAISKTAGEHYIRLSGLPFVSFRLANIYGPRQNSGPIPIFYKRLKAGQPCTVTQTRRDFMEIDDFLRLMDRALADDAPVGCYNVSSGQDHSIKAVFDLLVETMGVELTQPAVEIAPNDDDISTLLLDPQETERAFGWTAEIALTEGIRRQVEWFDAHGVGQTFTHLRIGAKS